MERSDSRLPWIVVAGVAVALVTAALIAIPMTNRVPGWQVSKNNTPGVERASLQTEQATPIAEARALVRQGRFNDAIRVLSLSTANAKSPIERANSMAAAAWIYRTKADLTTASKISADAAAIHPAALPVAIAVALDRGDTQRAAAFRHQLASSGFKPDARVARWLDARERLASGQSIAALASAQEALRQPGALASLDDLHTAVADAYVSLGRPRDAVKAYRDVLAADPDDALARWQLANLYAEMELRDASLAELDRFARTWRNADPDLPQVRSAWKQLSSAAAGSVGSAAFNPAPNAPGDLVGVHKKYPNLTVYEPGPEDTPAP